VVIYPPAKQPLVDSIVSQAWSKDVALQQGLQLAQQRVVQQPKLPWTYLELADRQIDTGDLTSATTNIRKGGSLGVPFEAHWLQLKLQHAGGAA